MGKTLRTPLIKPRTQGGTFYTFGSSLEDIGLNINELKNKIALSHYALINIPEFSGYTKYSTLRGDYTFADHIQNYVLNMETILRNSDNYNSSSSKTVAEKAFWKFAQKMGWITFKQMAAPNNEYYVENTTSFVKAVGLISAGAQRTDSYGIYNETFVQVPSSFGQTSVYFTSEEDLNFKSCKGSKFIANIGTDEHDSNGLCSTGLYCLTEADDSEYNYNVKYTDPSNVHEIVFSLDKLREIQNDSTLTFDELAMSKSIADTYNFNAALIYYSIYDSTGANVLATNLYGILVFDSASETTTSNKYKFTEIKKQKGTASVNGTSYAFRLNIKASSTYAGDIHVNDNSTPSYEMSEDFNETISNLNKAVEILKANSSLIVKINDDNQAIKTLSIEALDKVNDLEKTINNITINGGGGEGGAYFATYGETTHAKIVAALESGYAVFCKYTNLNNVYYGVLSTISSSDNTLYFGLINFINSTPKLMCLTVTTDNVWSVVEKAGGGGSSEDCVHIVGDETIDGNKTFVKTIVADEGVYIPSTDKLVFNNSQLLSASPKSAKNGILKAPAISTKSLTEILSAFIDKPEGGVTNDVLRMDEFGNMGWSSMGISKWLGDRAAEPTDPSECINGVAYHNTSDRKSYIFWEGTWHVTGIDGINGRDGRDGRDGSAGKDGSSGLNTANLTLYKRSADNLTNADCPISLTYSFSEKAYTGDMRGWSVTTPPYSWEPVWTTQCSVANLNNTVEIKQSDWSDPQKTVVDGISTIKSFVFKRCVDKPSPKPGPDEGSYENPVPEGWYDSVPLAEGREKMTPVWMTSRSFSSNGEKDPEWADIVTANDTDTIDREWNNTWGSLEEAKNHGPLRTSPVDTGHVSPDSNHWYDDPIPGARFMAVRTVYEGKYPEGSKWEISQVGGENGMNTATLTLYQKADTAPTVYPENVYYNFKTRKYSDSSSGTGTPKLHDWEVEIPEYDWRPTWCIQANVSSIDGYVLVKPEDWSNPPVQLFTDGISKFKSIVFCRDASCPDKPLDSSGTYSNPVPEGWFDTIPAASGRDLYKPVWMTSRTFVSTGRIEDGQDSSWSPVITANDTNDIEREWNNNLATLEMAIAYPPLRKSPIDKDHISPDVNGWHDEPIAGAKFMAVKRIVNGAYADENWSITQIGGEGSSSALLTLYQRAKEKPTLDPADVVYHFNTCDYTKPGDPSQPGELNGWFKTVPKYDWLTCWCIQVNKSSTDSSVLIESDEWSEPQQVFADGSNGMDGDQYEYIYGRANKELPVNISVIEIESERQKSQPDYMPSMRFELSNGNTFDVSTFASIQGVSEEHIYEFSAVRKKHNGVWGYYSTPGLCGNWVHAGLTPEEIEQIKTEVKSAVSKDIDDISKGLKSANAFIDDVNARLWVLNEKALKENESSTNTYIQGLAALKIYDASGQIIEEAATLAGNDTSARITAYRKIVDTSLGIMTESFDEAIKDLDSSVKTSLNTVNTTINSHTASITTLAANQKMHDASITAAKLAIEGLEARVELAATKSYVDGSLNNVRAEYSAGDASVRAQALTAVTEVKYLSKRFHDDTSTCLVDSSNYVLYYYNNSNKKVRLYSNELVPTSAPKHLYEDERYTKEWDKTGKSCGIDYFYAVHPWDSVDVGIPINESMSFIRQLSNEVNIGAIDGSAAAQIMLKASNDEGTDIVLNADRIHLKGDTNAEVAAINTAWIADAKITSAQITDGSIHRAEIVDASIHDCSIHKVYIEDASIEDASIIKCTISQSRIWQDNIDEAFIKDGSIWKAKIKDCSIEDGSIGRAYIYDASIEDASIIKGTISKAGIWDANIHNGSIDNAAIVHGTIETAEIDDCSINDCSINRAYIKDASIEDASIIRGTIHEMGIWDASINKSIIKDASIEKVKIKDASIENVRIKDASIENVTITDASIKKVTITDASIEKVTITDASIEKVTITDASIKKVIITDASIKKGIVEDVSIKHITLEDASIKKVTVTDASIRNTTINTAVIGNSRFYNVDENMYYSSNSGAVDISKSTFKYLFDSRIQHDYYDKFNNIDDKGYTLISKTGFSHVGLGNNGSLGGSGDFEFYDAYYDSAFNISRHGSLDLTLTNSNGNYYGDGILSKDSPHALSAHLSKNWVTYIRDTKDLARNDYEIATTVDNSTNTTQENTRNRKIQMWRKSYKIFADTIYNYDNDVKHGLISDYVYVMGQKYDTSVANITLEQLNAGKITVPLSPIMKNVVEWEYNEKWQEDENYQSGYVSIDELTAECPICHEQITSDGEILQRGAGKNTQYISVHKCNECGRIFTSHSPQADECPYCNDSNVFCLEEDVTTDILISKAFRFRHVGKDPSTGKDTSTIMDTSIFYKTMYLDPENPEGSFPVHLYPTNNTGPGLVVHKNGDKYHHHCGVCGYEADLDHIDYECPNCYDSYEGTACGGFNTKVTEVPSGKMDSSVIILLEPTVINQYTELTDYAGTIDEFIKESSLFGTQIDKSKIYLIKNNDPFVPWPPHDYHIMRYRSKYNLAKSSELEYGWVDEGTYDEAMSKDDTISNEWHRFVCYDSSSGQWILDDVNKMFIYSYEHIADRTKTPKIGQVQAIKAYKYNRQYRYGRVPMRGTIRYAWIDCGEYLLRNARQSITYYAHSDMNRMYFSADFYDNTGLASVGNCLYGDAGSSFYRDTNYRTSVSTLMINGPYVDSTDKDDIDICEVIEPHIYMRWTKYQYPMNAEITGKPFEGDNYLSSKLAASNLSFRAPNGDSDDARGSLGLTKPSTYFSSDLKDSSIRCISYAAFDIFMNNNGYGIMFGGQEPDAILKYLNNIGGDIDGTGSGYCTVVIYIRDMYSSAKIHRFSCVGNVWSKTY